MTRALIVYESIFGDARVIAHAIADGLADAMPADVVAAADAPAEIDPDVGLLVVGGPNHAFGMPRPTTRQSAVDQNDAHITDTHTGLHEWLGSARLTQRGTPAAAFDTRGSGHPVLTRMDHAAKTEEKLLGKLGATIAAPAEHFFVTGTEGPLAEGEEERARYWGRVLGELLTTGAVPG
ncbi:flavodoxin domain-containing protein [Blastococcus sp. URHD0036]|uniref:flavodoxin family protein n=1 Tax=Blastococcus sp. URHD0036 TaxID=1380356 RepID=UPI000497E140|nr:flavodoxin domain-containing protein [Blastococcus sp. URHD0036]